MQFPSISPAPPPAAHIFHTHCSTGQNFATRTQERGFTLVSMAVSMLALFGIVGLSVDIGRIYIAKSEAQLFTDSASLAATLELDGTQAGLTRARARVASNPNKWNFQMSSYEEVVTSFAKGVEGPWEEFPVVATGYRYARASTVVNVPVYFLSLFTVGKVNVTPTPAALFAMAPKFTMGVRADSSAGQQPATTFREGLFPFSPYAHNQTPPHYGLVPGDHYTFRWAANPRLNRNVCPGDNSMAMIHLAEAGGGSERGFIEETSADVIRQAITADYQTTWRGIGSIVNMTGGAKSSQRTSLLIRNSQDGNATATSYAQYVSSGLGTGRRVVAMPINTGYPDYRVVQIGAFFLLNDEEYPQGGNVEWCAEYLGPWVQGAKTKGAADGSGAYVVRLAR